MPPHSGLLRLCYGLAQVMDRLRVHTRHQLGLAEGEHPAGNPAWVAVPLTQLERDPQVPHSVQRLQVLHEVEEADVAVNLRPREVIAVLLGQCHGLPEVRHGGGPVAPKHLMRQPDAEERPAIPARSPMSRLMASACWKN